MIARSRPENDHDPHQYPQSRHRPGSSPLFSKLNLVVNAGDRIGIVAANGGGKSTLLPLHRRRAGADRRRHHPGARADASAMSSRMCRLPCSTSHSTTPCSMRCCRAGAKARAGASMSCWISADVPEALRERPSEAAERRLAAAGACWPVSGSTEPDVLDARRADQPSRPRQDRAAGGLAECAAARRAGDPGQPRPRLPRRRRPTARSSCGRSNRRSSLCPIRRARAALDEVDAADARRYERDMKAAQQLRKQAAKLNNIGINSGSDLLVVKTKQLKQRAEKLEDAAQPGASASVRPAPSGLPIAAPHAKVLVTLDDAAVETPDGTLLFKTGRQFVCQGDRIVLLGDNGAGKTRLIVDAPQGDREPGDGAGTASRPRLRWCSATATRRLPICATTDTPIGDDHPPLRRRRPAGARHCWPAPACRSRCRADRIGQLSGGQKARLGMLVLRLDQPELLPARRTHQPSRHRRAGSAGGRADGASGKLPARLARPQFRARGRQPVLADREAAAGGNGEPRGVLCVGSW